MQCLAAAGVLPGRVVSKTPRLETDRGSEIDAWLKGAPGPVASFVILDDMDDMAMHGDRLVLTSFDDGLNLGHAEEAIAVLERPCP